MAQKVLIQIRLPKKCMITSVRKYTTDSIDEYEMAEIEYIDVEKSGKEPRTIIVRKDYSPSCGGFHEL